MCGVDAVRDDAVIEVRRQGRQGYGRLLALFKNEGVWTRSRRAWAIAGIASARNSV